MSVQRIGPYEVHEQLGRGGMAAVYRAVDVRSGQEVALTARALAECRGERFEDLHAAINANTARFFGIDAH